MGNRFSSGKHALGICDMCGFQFKLNRLKPLVRNRKTTEILVCQECWEADHPQNELGRYPVEDPQALRNPRPDIGTETSRVLQWGWNPVGISNPLTPNSLLATANLGTVAVSVS